MNADRSPSRDRGGELPVLDLSSVFGMPMQQNRPAPSSASDKKTRPRRGTRRVSLFGMFAARPDALSQALSDLLTIRSGGHPWRSEDVKEQFGAAGLREIEYAGGDGVGSVVIGGRE